VEKEESPPGGILWYETKGQSLIPQLKDARLQVLGKKCTQCRSQALGFVVQLADGEFLDVHPKSATIQTAKGIQSFQGEFTH